MADAERDELKTLIRETIREMAKEAAEIWWNSPVNPPTSIGEQIAKLSNPMFSVPVGGPIGGWNERLDSR